MWLVNFLFLAEWVRARGRGYAAGNLKVDGEDRMMHLRLTSVFWLVKEAMKD